MASYKLSKFGQQLEREIQQKQWTDSEFARRIDVAPSQIIALKKTKTPRLETLKKVSKTLGKPVEYWKIGRGPRKSGAKRMAAISKRSLKAFLVVEQNGKEILRKPL